MPEEARLVLDAVIDDQIRILVTVEGVRKSFDVLIPNLKKILGRKKIVEGRSFLVTFTDDNDFAAFATGKIDEAFELQGSVTLRETTKKDFDEIRNLQDMLGLRV